MGNGVGRDGTSVVAVWMLALAASACGVTTKSLSVQPGVFNMAQVTGGVDPTNTCNPASSPAPDPAARWSAEPPSNRGLSTVGFEIWRNTTDGCQEHKEIAYRGLFQYDLTAVVPLKPTLTKAKISFFSKILPSGVTPGASNLCDPNAGGLGGLWELTGASPLPFPSNMQVINSTTPPFPAGVKLMSNLIPWQPGAIGNNTTTSGGPGAATFSVDVTTRIQGALNSNRTMIQFMLSGSDEAFPRPIPPPGNIDCRSLYEVQSLDVEYLGN